MIARYVLLFISIGLYSFSLGNNQKREFQELDKEEFIQQASRELGVVSFKDPLSVPYRKIKYHNNQVGLTLKHLASVKSLTSLGFQQGDILSRINDVRIRSFEDFVNTVLQYQHASIFRVEIIRKNKPHLIFIRFI